ncbi:MG2 domain-containing protein [Oceanospirillum sediminis]|uniref:Alpha-2-macroglobulin n=1 Tax=Oceanospirillum sediminis TaxID=2760088 RepID=A0A839IVS7_9GAMM|nr:MG2 domain-containing protein [Oceanospirillum sediminis]MBB1488559.1 alpha-2-macroglobulin family protein [Oceanospirillum sediminis]
MFRRFTYYLISLIALIMLSACSEEPQAVKKIETEASGITTTETENDDSVPATSAYESKLPFKLQDISEQMFGDINAIALKFSQPLKSDQAFSTLVHTQPLLPDPVLSNDGRTLYLTGIEPEQSYQVRVEHQILGIQGQWLPESTEKTIKTRAMNAALSFEVDGAVMVPGKVDALPVMSVNVPEADLELYRVKPESMPHFFSEYDYLKQSWYAAENLEQHLEHVYSMKLQLGENRNQRYKTNIPLQNIPALKQQGIYLAMIRQAGRMKFQDSTWFTLSSIGLQIREFSQQLYFISQDIATGKALPNTEIRLLGYNGELIDSGMTDASGLWSRHKQWPEDKQPQLILAMNNGQVTALQYHNGWVDLSAFELDKTPYQSVEHLILTPRNIYRPGELLSAGVLKRAHDGRLAGGDVKLRIYQPNGDIVTEQTLSDAAIAGYYPLQYQLADNAPSGTWQLAVFSPESEKETQWFDFLVEDFLPEKLRLEVEGGLDNTALFTRQQLPALKVTGEYLYGAPAAGNKLNATVQISAWHQPLANQPGYFFGQPDNAVSDTIYPDSVHLNDDGQTELTLTNRQYPWSKASTPLKLTYSLSLFEQGGRAINRETSALYWPAASFVGVKPGFENHISGKNSEVFFDLIRANAQGEPLNSGEVQLELHRIEENYFWSYTRERGWFHEVERKEYPIAEQRAVLTSDGPLRVLLPVEWGKYRLELVDLTSGTRTIYPFQAGESWFNEWMASDQLARPDRVSLALDKAAYQPGDEVTVRLNAPTEGRALILLETDRILFSEEVLLIDKKATFSFRVPDSLNRHDAYISAFVIAPTDDNDKFRKRSAGFAHLPLDRSARQLQIVMDLPERLLPESENTVQVEVTDAAGQAFTGEAWVSLAIVDSGILSVTGYTMPDPFEFFYSARGYGANWRDMYADVAEQTLYKAAGVRWGGDGLLARGGQRPDVDIKLLSLFHKPVKVVNGIANLNFDLPVFDGEVTLMATAFAGSSFGSEQQAVKVVSPVVADLARPRFLSKGDQSQLTFELTNTSEKALQIDVALSISGAISEQGISESGLSEDGISERSNPEATSEATLTAKEEILSIHLMPGKRHIMPVPVTADSLGQGTIHADITLVDPASSDPELTKKQLQRSWSVSVRSAVPAVYHSVTQALEKGQSLAFPPDQLAGFQPESVQAQLRVSNVLGLDKKRHLDFLQDYPYACLEQTTSKASALLYQDDYTGFKAAMTRLAELQHENGGFGLWYNQSPEERWLTVHVTDLMLRLKQEGYLLPDGLLEMALSRVESYAYDYHSARRNAYYEAAYRLYAAYVLAKEGRISLGKVRGLIKDHLRYGNGALAGVLSGYALIYTGQQAEGIELIARAMPQKREHYSGDYGSVIRDDALMMALILEEGAIRHISHDDRAALEKKLQQLVIQVQQSHYLSTQEHSALLRLAVQLDQRSAKAWQGTLAQSGEETLLEAKKKLIVALDRTLLADTRFIYGDKGKSETGKGKSETGVLYATYDWTALPAGQPEDFDLGISVRANYFKVENNEALPLTDKDVLRPGDLVLTHVNLRSQKDLADVLLSALLPAGLELENQQLKHAIKLEGITLDGQVIQTQAALEYEAYLDDRYAAALELYKGVEADLYYLSRVVTPGQYQVPPVLAESMYQPEIRGQGIAVPVITVQP